MSNNRKVFVIGLDCATPQLVFDQWREVLPNMSALMEQGIWGPLESVIPPITCPAWMCMMSSRNPGRLGIYGFRNRRDYSYDNFFFANATAIHESLLWDLLGQMGKQTIMVGVPQTYPPKPVNGCLVASFLTPSIESPYTYPRALKLEIERVVGRYMLDVENFRTDDKDRLLREIYEMTEKRFALVRHLMTTRAWDFFMMVEMGVDRIHHGFWKYFDRNHPKYEPGSPFEHAIRDYYILLDTEIGRLRSLMDSETVVLMVSDHGAQAMEGGICFNEWLIQEGYLKLKEKPKGLTAFRNELVDWSRTIAWGAGGYYGRLFVNVKGREPEGFVDPDDYERVRDELAEKLEAMTDPQGRPLGTKVFKPQQIYPEVRGIPPDLLILFGNLTWRSVGSVGMGAIHTFENDTGPDDANHAMHGIFVMTDPGSNQRGRRERLHLLDVAPTILDRMGMPIPPDMEGKVLA